MLYNSDEQGLWGHSLIDALQYRTVTLGIACKSFEIKIIPKTVFENP